jgi:Bacterial archaeo-eukaryotic release factor family 3
MNTTITPEIKEIISAVHYRPAISIIMPFEPKMGLKTALAYTLKNTADKVEKELEENYPADICVMVMQKLRKLIKGLNFNTYKKSIAIYVSPVFEKILYLDIPLEEKIIIDESFEIRDLVYSKKQLHKYLVLLLSSNESSIYLGNIDSFVRIVSNAPEAAELYKNDLPEKLANFSDPAEVKRIYMEKFLRHVDNSLDIILTAYNLPLFVLGTDRIVGHFKKLTKHATAVIEYVHGNYENDTTEELKKLLQPYIRDWKKVQEKNLLNRLEEAASDHKLSVGIKEVWREAINKKGRLLLVEKNYMCMAQHGDSEEIIYKVTEPFNKFSYIKDAVDDVIEKVLENGGDVEFVDEGILKNHQQIALIQYY